MTRTFERSSINETRFEHFFRAVSYASVFCGFSALWLSGSIGILATVLFVAALVTAWRLEDTRWQIGEKLGTALIVLSLPVFYGLWQLLPGSGDGIWIAGLLARMILCLTSVKLLQKKSDRDWIFLYLMAFFEVLLAAGLSISGLYLLNFIAYLLLMACAIIAFEIRKTSYKVGRELAAYQPDNQNIKTQLRQVNVRRIPASAVSIIVFTVLLALPLFFLLPRVGGAGLGSAQRGLTMSGFSDKVTLGNFGRITEDDRVVMRVKFDELAAVTNNLYFRGLALDTFDNKSWTRSTSAAATKSIKPVDGVFDLSGGARAPGPEDWRTGQTIVLEPIQTPVLFALPRAVRVEGNFSNLTVDSSDSIQQAKSDDRVRYRVVSDTSEPDVNELIADRAPTPRAFDVYRSLPPHLDPRVTELAWQVTSQFNNRYEQARAVEAYLQKEFGYTLDQKASGEQPLANFLFEVKEGHCEYFASAMAIMLRTQGIATRVVNGFHGGDYNEAGGFTVVRQRHAHAWVEVYFPGSNRWVTFDPTPIGNQPGDGGAVGGVIGTLTGYAEALEAMWIEYFVAYDEDGQDGLRASAAIEFSKFQNTLTAALGVAHQATGEWMSRLRGDHGAGEAAISVAYFVAAVLVCAALLYFIFWISRRLPGFPWFKRIAHARARRPVEFYEQLIALLAARGMKRSASQTPLEFALATNLPEALTITKMYQKVRFGEIELSESESAEMSEMIRQLKDRR